MCGCHSSLGRSSPPPLSLSLSLPFSLFTSINSILLFGIVPFSRVSHTIRMAHLHNAHQTNVSWRMDGKMHTRTLTRRSEFCSIFLASSVLSCAQRQLSKIIRTSKWARNVTVRSIMHSTMCALHWQAALPRASHGFNNGTTSMKTTENNGNERAVAARRIKVSLYLIKNFVIL